MVGHSFVNKVIEIPEIPVTNNLTIFLYSTVNKLNNNK